MVGNILVEVVAPQLLGKPAQSYRFEEDPGLSEAQYSIYSERSAADSNATFIDTLEQLVPATKQAEFYAKLPLLAEPNNHNSSSIICKDEELALILNSLPSITAHDGPNEPSIGTNLCGINYISLPHPQHPSPSQYSDPSSPLISGDNYFNEGQDEANCLAQHSNQASLDSNGCSLITRNNHPLIIPSSITSIRGFASAKHELPCMVTSEQYGSRNINIDEKKKNMNVVGDGVDEKIKKRNRSRSRMRKNIEEMESQRMTHIAVERNRRRQINERLSALRSLMPCSYIQRGDQASIVGGTIKFVAELEQVLKSLRLQKQLRGHKDESTHAHGLCYLRPHLGLPFSHVEEDAIARSFYDLRKESYACSKSSMANVEVAMASSSAIFVKVLAQKRPHQLLYTLSGLHNLSLKVLHLNITTIELTTLYSFNLEMEDDCRLQTPTRLAESIQHIFGTSNS